jgi:hypothetical protein
MSKKDIDIDALLNRAEKEINPNLSKNLQRNINDLEEGKEEYIGEIASIGDTDLFQIFGEKVEQEELEEALEILTDPGYERETLRFYAQLVEYSKDLLEPILNRNQMQINEVGLLNNPVQLFVQRKMLALLEQQIKLLQEIRDGQRPVEGNKKTNH